MNVMAAVNIPTLTHPATFSASLFFFFLFFASYALTPDRPASPTTAGIPAYDDVHQGKAVLNCSMHAATGDQYYKNLYNSSCLLFKQPAHHSPLPSESTQLR